MAKQMHRLNSLEGIYFLNFRKLKLQLTSNKLTN